jgi:hypothetical protein
MTVNGHGCPRGNHAFDIANQPERSLTAAAHQSHDWLALASLAPCAALAHGFAFFRRAFALLRASAAGQQPVADGDGRGWSLGLDGEPGPSVGLIPRPAGRAVGHA